MKVTILIPTWNSEAYIKRAITSILNSNLSEFEIIIADNCSTDKTKEIVAAFNNKRILFIQQKDSGLYDALNKAINASTGQIIGWIGNDDYYIRNGLETIVKTFEQCPNTLWVAGNGVFVHESANGPVKQISHTLPQHIDIKSLLAKNSLISPCVVFKKELFDQVGGFDLKYKLAADYKLWLSFAKLCPPTIVSTTIAAFSYNNLNISSKRKIELYQETIKILKEFKKTTRYRLPIHKNILRLNAYILYNFSQNKLGSLIK